MSEEKPEDQSADDDQRPFTIQDDGSIGRAEEHK